MPKLANPVLMAKMGAAHGIRGEVRVQAYTVDPVALAGYAPLVDRDGRAYEIKALRPAKDGLVVAFKGVSDRNGAEMLNGVELFVDRSMLPNDTDEDEFYLADLIGLDAVDEEGNLLGHVVDVPNYGAGDLVEIAPVMSGKIQKNRSWHVAFTRETVPDIDLEAGRLTVIKPAEVSERDD